MASLYESYGIADEPVQAPAAPEPEKSGLIRRIAGDGILTGLKGAIGVPEAAVGLADLVSGGAAGKFAEDIGFRPKEAKAMLDEYYSPQQKAAFAAVQNAANPDDPFLSRAADIAGAAISNPSTIVHAVGESLPSIGAGGVIGRGVMAGAAALSPRIATAIAAPLVASQGAQNALSTARIAAAGIGEGVVAAGSSAEQIRQGTKDGYLTGGQSLIAAGSGMLTGVLGMASAKAAKALGIGDIDTLLVGGGKIDPALEKGFIRKVLESVLTEGGMEELPQSVQEQVAQNYALGKPLDEGVDNASVMGVLTGGAMGASAQVLSHRKVPEVGPLSRAVNVDGGAAVPQEPAQPLPPVAMSPEQEQTLLALANWRNKALTDKANGTKDVKTTAEDGTPVTIPGKQPEFLTPAEKEEQAFLAENGGDVQALARAYPGVLAVPEVAELPAQAPIAATQQAIDVPPETPGQVAELPPVAPAVLGQPSAEAFAAREQDRPAEPTGEVLPGDILTPRGNPFKNMAAAMTAQKRAGDTHEIVRVAGGLVVRQKAQSDGTSVQTAGLDRPAATGQDSEPAGSAIAPVVEPASGQAGAIQDNPGLAGGGGQALAVPLAGTSSPAVAPTGNSARPQKLPVQLAGAKPRYNYGAKQFFLNFASDIDRAAYITAQGKASSRDADYLAFVTQSTGMTDEQVRAHGVAVRESIKAQAKDATPGTLDVAEVSRASGKVASETTTKTTETTLNVPDSESTLAQAPSENPEWTRMPHAERLALTTRTGMSKLVADKIARTPWADITLKTRTRIEAAMAAPVSDMQTADAPVAPKPAKAKKQDKTRAARLAAYDKNPLITFIAAHGLYHDKDQPGSLKSEFSPDKEIMVPGYGPVFRKMGKRLDALVQNAIEDGYLPKDGTEQQLYSLIQRAVGGEKITPQYAEGVAESEAQAQMDARAELEQEQYGADNSEPATADEIEAALDAEMEASDAAFFAVDDSDIPWDAPGNSSTEAFLRAMGATEQEIRDGLAQEQNGQSSSNQAGAGTQEAITGAAQAGNGGRSPQAGDSVAARPGGSDSEGLTAPTRDDVLAQQDRADKADKAAKAEKAQKAAQDLKDKQERERKDIAKASEAAADTFTLGGDPMENLTGQQDVFGQPDKPAASKNTIFTEDAAEKARARLKAKLRNLNSGLDPEMMLDGITLAGYHIEKGARTFAAYAKAMLADLGDGAKPYLKSWYLAAKFDPRTATFDGMDSAASVESAEIDVPAESAEKATTTTQETPAIVEHVTGNGKTLRGVVRTDLSLAEAKAIDKFTFKKDGGFFIREEHLDALNAAHPESGNIASGNPTLETTEGRHVVAKLVADHLIGGNKFATIIEARKFIADKTGTKIEPGTDAAKRADEAIELGVVIASREIVYAARKQGHSDDVIFKRLVSLYEAQPSLNVRDSVSLRNQAYSTPVPLAFVASRLARITSDKKVGEPTAGNGALMMEADPKNATVNEIQDDRLEALRSQGFAPTQNDAAAMAFKPKSLQSMAMNPPFGPVNGKKWTFGDFTTGEIDHAIVMNSLEALKDDGDAVLIIGGTLAIEDEARKDAYRGKAKREFFYNLYGQYNVVDHFTVSGDLYKKQGAAYPVDVLVIRGRGKSARGLPAAQLPQLVNTWDELKGKLNETDSLGAQGAGNSGGGGSSNGGDSDQGGLSGSSTGPSGRHVAGGGSDGLAAGVGLTDGSGVIVDSAGSTAASGAADHSGQRGNDAGAKTAGDTGGVTTTGGNQQQGSTEGNRPNKPAGVDAGNRKRVDPQGIAEAAASGKLQVSYANFSGNRSVNTLVATNHLSAIANAFKNLQKRVGDIDSFVMAELQYEPEQFAKSFSAEQVEALALAIDNIGQGKGFIIGDQTGIGKGRVVAAMIRYAKLNGKTPVFVTQMPDLYGDMMRDLNDIGMAGTRPLMTNNNASVPLDSEALKWFGEKQGIQTRITELLDAMEDVAIADLGEKATSMEPADRNKAIATAVKTSTNPELVSLRAEIKELKESMPERRGKFLDTPAIDSHERTLQKMVSDGSIGDHDVIFTTYNQMAALDSGKPKKDKETGERTASKPAEFGYRNTFLERFVNSDSMLILDESHNAGERGDGRFPKVGDVVRRLISQSGGVFYSSATFAKNTAVMDVYSKTDLGSAFSNPEDLVNAINSVPMQQITSAMLVEAGQYLRRERSFEGIEYKTESVEVDQQAAEDVSTAMRLVVAFDSAKKEAIAEIQNELDQEGAVMAAVNGGGSLASVDSLNFTSVMHNVVNTFLLALKADAAANSAISAIRAGEKPIITVANTMEMFITEFAKESGLGIGDTLNATFGDVLKRYLEKTRKAKITSPGGQSEVVTLTDDQLGSDGVEAYEAALEHIESMDLNIPLSPIDHIKQKIEEAGFSIGEITGRQTVVVNGILRNRNKAELNTAGKKNTIANFNGGELDALIINRSGSTGLSMHASETFADKRRRVMIVAQAELDINNHMQMLGRINRTGQVTEGPFDSDTPERRGSLAMRQRNAMQNARRINALSARTGKVQGGIASPARTAMGAKQANAALKLAQQGHAIPEPTDDGGKGRTYGGKPAAYGLPRYAQMTANVPIELRPAAVLSNKMAGLNANTTAGRKSAVEDKSALDFMNKYGDRVAAEMVGGNIVLNEKLGFPIKLDEHGAPFVQGAISRVTGRIGLLPLAEQADLYSQLAAEYGDLMAQLDALGQNDLEAKTYPLDAETVEKKVLQKADAGTASPFTSAVTAEKVNIRKLGKPYPKAKVQELVKEALGGVEAMEARRKILSDVTTQINAEVVALQGVMNSATASERITIQKHIDSLNSASTRFRQSLPAIGLSVVLKTDAGNMYGIVTGIDKKGKAKSAGALSAWKIRIAVVDGARSMTLPLTQLYVDETAVIPPNGIVMKQASDMTIPNAERNGFETVPVLEAFDRGQTDARENRIIITGNILRGYGVLRGRLLNYTDNKGGIQQGILMPADFDIDSVAARFTPTLKSEDEVIGLIDKGGVVIDKGTTGETLRIQKSGSVYIVEVAKTGTGKKLAKNAEGLNFVSSGNKMRVRIWDSADLRAFLKDTVKPEGISLIPNAASTKLMEGGDSAAYSRSIARTSGQPAERVQSTVNMIVSRWVNAPKVVVVQNLDDPRVPDAVRKDEKAFTKTAAQQTNSTNNAGSIDGFIDRETGTIFLVADKLAGDADVVRVLMHESLGHFGLRGLYGTQLGTILDRMAVLNADKVKHAAKRLELDYNNPVQRRVAAEEVLAYMAQNSPELGWVKKTVAAIRSWARNYIPGFSNMRMSDDELIRNFIIPARNWVENGGPEGGGGGKVATRKTDSTGNSATPAMYSRNLGEALTSGINNVRDVKLAAGYQVSDLFQGEGRLGWWHKSVGSMYHLAHKSVPFKRVYDSIQNFLNDVSFYAAEAADLAPTILPKLDKATDALPKMTIFGKEVGQSPLSPEDTKALSAPVFEGTLAWGRNKAGVAMPSEDIEAELGATSLDDKANMLMRAGHIDPKVLRMWQGLPMEQYEAIINGKFEKQFMKPGVVFTPAELKEHFKMTDAQVALYQEFRKATDKSIDNLAISEMLNYAGKDALPIREQVLESASVSEAGQTLRDYLVSLVELEPERDEVLSATAAKMLDIAAHAQDMKDRGYAPLSRFGTYTLEATLDTGERYFSLFETDRERNKAARMLGAEGATGITSGTMSQEAYKLLNGVSPETAALFGEMLGLDSQGNEAKDLAFQEFIKRGTANRSAMKRLLKRKGIAGFSDDAGRVLAGFVYSNARKTASNLHTKETSQAVSDIPKEQGELKDAAVKLQEYVSNPMEEAAAFRGLLFAQYLGGSVASAMVNATQPFTTTLPYLSQFGGIRKAGAQMLAAVQDAAKHKTGDVRLDAALKKAEEEGIVSPQEVHQLMAQAMGRANLKSGDGTTVGDALAKGSNALSKLSMAWGKVFGIAEQFNRRTTFIAAYRTAVEQGIADPAKFAEKAVNETQFVANKGNKPRWARGAVGSVLFTFKSYSVNYLELVTRMATAGEPGSPERLAGQKAAVLAIAILFMMAGAEGLPFVEDIQDVIDGAMQRLGYNFSSKQQMKTFLTLALGKDGAEFAMSGVSGLPGAPIDVSGRLGMGNLIPGTGLFQKKTDHTRDLMELAGPGGDMVKRGFTGAEQMLGGNFASGLTTISPKAAQNVAKAIDMADTGMYRDDKGRKIIDTTTGEAFAKAIGFQPRSVKNVQEASMEVQKAKSQYILASGEIRAAMAQAIFMDDEDMKQRARDSIAAWNEKNPDQRMTLDMPAVLRKVREMRKTKEQRMADTAPKAIRAQVRDQLKEELH